MRPGFELDHVGIAVRSLDQAFGFYRAMGWTVLDKEEVPSEKVRVGFVRFENQVTIELLEPLSDESVIAKFLNKKGEGIHHLCFRVKGLEQVMEKLKGEGLRLLDESPRTGAHNCRVAFIHPASANGVLVELSEKKSGGR